MALGKLFQLALAVTRRILPSQQYDFNIAVAEELDALDPGATSFSTIAIAAPVGGTRLIDMAANQFSTLSTGALVYVQSVKDRFRWDPLSTVTADNITVVNPTANGVNPGRFLRVVLPAIEWSLQAAWFVDNGNAAANDENAGTALLPLKTNAELNRRWGIGGQGGTNTGINQATMVTYPTAPADALDFNVVLGPQGTLMFVGTMTNVPIPAGGVGTFSVVQAINRGGNLVMNVTDGTRAWTAGQRLRITSGARLGAVAWVTKDLTGGLAEVTPFMTIPAQPSSTAPTLVTPVAGDPYVVETLPVAQMGYMRVGTQGPFSATLSLVAFSQIEIDGSFAAQSVLDVANADCVLSNCFLKSLLFKGTNGTTFLFNCHQSLSSVLAGICQFFGGGTIGAAPISATACFVLPGATVRFDGDFLAADCAGGIITSSNLGGGNVAIGQAAAMRCTSGVTLKPGASCRQLTLSGGANALYGSGNGTGVTVNSGAQYFYATKPTIASTVQDALVGGTAKAWGAIPFIEPANNAAIVAFA